MNIGTGYERKYYVVFSRSISKRWYLRLLNRYFRHVTLLRRSDCGEHWIYIGTQGGNVWVDTFPYCNIRDVFRDDTIFEYWSVAREKPTLRFWHLNCVEFVKSVLGIRSWRVITPLQLYNFIKENSNGKYAKSVSAERQES